MVYGVLATLGTRDHDRGNSGDACSKVLTSVHLGDT